MHVSTVSKAPLPTLDPTTVIISWPEDPLFVTATGAPLYVNVQTDVADNALNVQTDGRVNLILSPADKGFVKELIVTVNLSTTAAVV